MLFKIGLILVPLILCALVLPLKFKKTWPSYLLMSLIFFGTTIALLNYRFITGPNAITGDPIMLNAVMNDFIKMASLRGLVFITASINIVAYLRKKSAAS